MTKQPHYVPIVRKAFSQYLDEIIDLDTLVDRLRGIELQVMSDDEENETGKGLWFRFFEGDPLKTTIADIEKELSDPTHPSYNILRQGIAFGLQADELEVHYT